ncbi:MAG: DUF541 domain-containing protein [Nitrosopumilus sp.]|nr:MAG: DUF541 domain-containing protein [Nitrosopumilus sp.]
MKMSKSKTFAIGAALAAVMMISAGSLYLEDNMALAQRPSSDSDDGERLISVTGTAMTSIDPDLLVVTFGVETQEETAKMALDTNSKTMNEIISAIKSIKITEDEINTSRFNIHPVYEGYEDPLTKRWKQELVGYEVTNTITVETSKLDLAADIIDSAITSGANRVDNVSFTISPEKHEQIKDDLIEKAILNAKAKAENALEPLDYSITGVKAVSLSEFGMPSSPMPMFNMAYDEGFAMKSSGTSIFSSEQDVSTTANVIFTIGSN